ncbi:MAG: DUF4197 domain-containing protein [Chitinophagaceae bacterium]|nr:MAG: DUF4197 domain-containing protein [Chitinophagaceae bacterium]
MRSKLVVTFALFAFISAVSSCDTLGQMTGTNGVTTNNGTPSNSEINSGIKQALQVGVEGAVQQVSALNGYFDNPLIKIMFPPNAAKVEKTLRDIGLGSLCDKLELSLNRAAEDAAKQATPIFLNALKQMTLGDATNILTGSDTAATAYFERTTTSQLTAQFSPVISKSLNQANATKYWSDVTTQYNKIPFIKPVNTDLTAYVTQQAINGLFVVIGQKEKQIRGQLGARTTPLLQKVFGYAQKLNTK